MGRAKDALIERQEEKSWEEKCQWIREQLEDDEADECTAGWDELSEEFSLINSYGDSFEDWHEDEWSVVGKTRFEIFDETIKASKSILDVTLPQSSYKNLWVMLYGHIVAAIESYLSSTFIEITLSTDNYMRRLVESDPEFASRKFTIKEIFVKHEDLKDDLRMYLKELIFHDIAKVRRMYLAVLDISFGNVDWLFRAVVLRHDCVHRAGYDKEGAEVSITKETVAELMDRAVIMVDKVESVIANMQSYSEIIF